MYFIAAVPRIICSIRSSGLSVHSGTKTEILLLLWVQEWEMQHVTLDRIILTYFNPFKKPFIAKRRNKKGKSDIRQQNHQPTQSHTNGKVLKHEEGSFLTIT